MSKAYDYREDLLAIYKLCRNYSVVTKAKRKGKHYAFYYWMEEEGSI